ncbi:FKBP-type peptidyl-prolyl cis-trans isomerase [Pedobacter gandavensis]|uniref:FKBP-type peptidyl-prolyl cis-trans isomerase n=1 Tax=Pedobacter gandavensis TaxID=2679963 RepID=UPI00292EF3C9|nr:FKBP-type peptidyl-prolyl cis-trans isomerase [Pedobacter gandavensis]
MSLLLLCGLFAACEKTPPYDVVKQQELDALIIEKYKEKAGLLDLTVDPSGLNYGIISIGTGADFPTDADSIVVRFEARILGQEAAFQSISATDSVTLKLGTAMEGWRIGMPKIKTGGQIRMIIPSALAYKDFGSTDNRIPPFSILDYTVTLMHIK